MVKSFCFFLIALLAYLQYLVWFGDSGFFARQATNQDLKKIEDKLLVMKEKNRILSNQIRELKVNTGAIESYARLKLGMIERGELFFMVPETTSSPNE
tara:strand:- start:6 stop:299 length:294 start_codon:yes stop_codon:yes gene_type:complete